MQTLNPAINGAPDEYALYARVLNEAHKTGLRRISTNLLQAPHQANEWVAIISAQVETDRGLFNAIGDANPDNVNGWQSTQLIRVAETRAKLRALCDALNMAEVDSPLQPNAETNSKDVMKASVDSGAGESNDARSSQATESRSGAGIASEPESASEASAHQIATIQRLSRLLGRPPELPANISVVEASALISRLAREFNEGRRSSHI